MKVEGYEELWDLLTSVGGERALQDAYEQSAGGKGKERHADDRRWVEQPIFTIPSLVNSDGFAVGQAMKKLHEQQGMEWYRGRHECLGAIVYLAAAAVRLLQEDQTKFVPSALTKDADMLPIISKLSAASQPGIRPRAKVALIVDAIGLISQYVERNDDESPHHGE